MSERESGDQRERRVAPRYPVRAPAEFENGTAGTGVTENLSTSGVLLEETTSLAPVQSRVELRFSFYAGSFGTRFSGTVVRHTESGFAVQFSELANAQLEVIQQTLPSRLRERS